MQWNNHSNLEGMHAIIGGSNYHWLNYDAKKLAVILTNMQAKEEGTALHALAKQCIDHKIFLRGNTQTLPMYVNDAIRFGMRTEQILMYSMWCFGTADAIKFDEKNKFLRIHDLKTGTIPAKMEQLEIYAALFCLEYGKRYNYQPTDGSMELRIYQNDDVQIYNPTADDIVPIMDKIISFDKYITEWKEQHDNV